jgi:hypothetical protein
MKNPRQASRRLLSRRRKRRHIWRSEPRDDIGHDFRRPTPSVATPSKDAIFTTGDQGDGIGKKFGKMTSTRDTIFCANGPRNATGHNVENRHQASRRQQKTTYLALVSHEMPFNRMLENRRRETRCRSSRRPHKMPFWHK